MEGTRRAAVRRSSFNSCAHCVTSTLRSRREACNLSRALSVVLLPGDSSLTTSSIARRNTSDLETFQCCDNVSSARTDSTSSEYVDFLVVVAMCIVYGLPQAKSIFRAFRFGESGNRGWF